MNLRSAHLFFADLDILRTALTRFPWTLQGYLVHKKMQLKNSTLEFSYLMKKAPRGFSLSFWKFKEKSDRTDSQFSSNLR